WSDEETHEASEGTIAVVEEARRIAESAGLDLGTDFSPEDFEEVDQSNDFDCFIAGLEELGYGVATRVFDAQYFGVPQRRRRVFVVGCLGDWRRAAAVLFERESLRGDHPPRRSAGQAIAGTLTASALDGSSLCGGDGRDGLLISGTGPDPFFSETVGALCSNGRAAGSATGQDAEAGHLIAGTVTAKWAKGSGGPSGGPSGDECQNLVSCQDVAPPLTGNIHGDNPSREGLLVAFDSKASGRNGFAIGEVSPTLRAMGHKESHGNAGGQVAIAFDPPQITSPDNRSNPQPGDPCHTLAKGAQAP